MLELCLQSIKISRREPNQVFSIYCMYVTVLFYGEVFELTLAKVQIKIFSFLPCILCQAVKKYNKYQSIIINQSQE